MLGSRDMIKLQHTLGAHNWVIKKKFSKEDNSNIVKKHWKLSIENHTVEWKVEVMIQFITDNPAVRDFTYQK
jgi:hypothetical protein